ncbi:MAG: hypothetical protein AAF799_36840 [Myxococcota bacterium]
MSLGLAATPAWAGPTVMVWPGEAQAPVARAEASLRGSGHEVRARADVDAEIGDRRGALALQTRERSDGIERALTTAEGRYLSQEFDAMLEGLSGAEADALALARPGHCEGLWALQFQRGLGRGARGLPGDAEASEDRYGLALELDGQRRPLHEVYGPDVSAAFLRAVQRQSLRVPTSVPVQVEPADATVEIDCQPVDSRSPSLRPGLHAVRVSAPGFAPHVAVVDLRSSSTVDVQLVALPASERASHRWADSTDSEGVDDGSESAHAAVLSVAESEGAVAVLVLSPVEGGWRVRPWGRDGIGSAVERADLDVALDAAMKLLDDEGHLHTPAPVVAELPLQDPPTGRRSVFRTWWFWTAAATVVATGVAVGLGVGLGRRSSSPEQLVIVAR